MCKQKERSISLFLEMVTLRLEITLCCLQEWHVFYSAFRGAGFAPTRH